MSDPAKLLTTIQRATERLRAHPSRRGALVELEAADVDDVCVVGDLHGHFEVLASVLKIAALDKHPKRHLIVQELVHDTRIDPDEEHIDRSHRTIDLVCALICQYPTRVHYLLGNHELSEITGRSIAKNGHALNELFRKGVTNDYASHVDVLMHAYLELFRSLPLAVRLPNRVLACHTVPDALSLEKFDRAVFETGVWTDDSTKRGGTVYAMTWSRDDSAETADKFANWIDADLFVCGHQPCDDGFRQSNHRTLIVDGTDPAPAYALFSAQAPLTMDQLRATARHVPLLGQE